MEMWVDVRMDVSMDGFRVDYHETSTYLDDVSNPEGTHTRHHLTTFALSQLDRQHRTFMFSVTICGIRVRFTRWDRAGAIITKHFDLRKDPRLLAEFFWRYGRLSRVDRGFDHTVQAATDTQKKNLASAVHAYLSQEDIRVVSGMERTVDADFPCHILTLADYSGGARQFVIQRPFSTSSTTVGRATRAYIALDTTSEKLVFLKDYWRPLEAERTPEAEVYSSLQPANVPHLPHLRYGGDVPGVHDHFQTTLTQDWQGRPGIARCARLTGYRHHRMVQDILFSLKTARSSRELVVALCNTVSCEPLIFCSLPNAVNLLHFKYSIGSSRRLYASRRERAEYHARRGRLGGPQRLGPCSPTCPRRGCCSPTNSKLAPTPFVLRTTDSYCSGYLAISLMRALHESEKEPRHP